MNDLRTGNFMILFQMLSCSKGSLYISSYGVKSTSLEEVFMKAITENVIESESTPDNDSNDFELDSNSHQVDASFQMMESVDDKIGNSKVVLTVPDSGFESDPNSISLGNLRGSGRGFDLGNHCSGDFLDEFDENLTDATTSFIDIHPPLMNVVPSNQTAQINYEKISGNQLILQQFGAILQKRYLCTKRNIEGLFSQVKDCILILYLQLICICL